MPDFFFSWSIGDGKRRRTGSQVKPGWFDVEIVLKQLAIEPGVADLDIVDAAEIGPQSLQVRSDQGSYLLLLGEHDEEDHHVRSFTNLKSRPGTTEILGDLWDSRQVCSDFEVVQQTFREFYYQGNVSHDLLD